MFLIFMYSAVNCGTPPDVINGSPGTQDMTTLGGMVTYTCDIGYILSGSPTVSCLASGSWSTRPTCIGMYNIVYYLFVTHEYSMILIMYCQIHPVTNWSCYVLQLVYVSILICP